MDAQILDMRLEGNTWEEIGTALGRGHFYIRSRYMKELDPSLHVGWTPERIEYLNESVAQGKSWRDVSEELLTSQAACRAKWSSLNADIVQRMKTEKALKRLATRAMFPSGRLINTPFHVSGLLIRRVKWCDHMDALLISFKDRSLNWKQIGTLFGMTPITCYNRYQDHIVPQLKSGWTPPTLTASNVPYYLLPDRKRPSTAGTWQGSPSGEGEAVSQLSTIQGNMLGLAGEDFVYNSFEPTSGRTWTPEEDNYIVEKRQEEVSFKDISEHLGIEPVLCYNRYFIFLRPGTKHRAWTPSMEEKLLYLIDQGLSWTSIGVELGFHRIACKDKYKEIIQERSLSDGANGDTPPPALDKTTHSDHVEKADKNLAGSSNLDKGHQSIWDKDSAMSEIRKTWTTEEETMLIQHVIRNGTRGWQEVSHMLNGHHSAEECRAYWKYLDMPIRQSKMSWEGRDWGPYREAQFWRLWLECGSNFDEISRRMNKGLGSRRERSTQIFGDMTMTTPEDCRNLFSQRTQHLTESDGEDYGHEKFQKDCARLALTRSLPRPFVWDKEKSVKLQKLVLQRLRTRHVQHDWINWKWVARHIGDVSIQTCSSHWRSLRLQTADAWTEEEILLLEQGIREVGGIFNTRTFSSFGSSTLVSSTEPNLTGFRAIQKFYLPHRSAEVIQRKFFVLSDKASTVTLDEYMAIMNAVDEHGVDQWDKVVSTLQSASSPEESSASSTSDISASLSPADKSSSEETSIAQEPTMRGWRAAPCRRVWKASYKHHLLYTKWTPEEDQDLKTCVENAGQNEWVVISRFFPGKSAWQCRLRWCQLTDPIQPISTTALSGQT